MDDKRSSFSGSIGFVLAAAGSAIGLGNLWRFPYLAAQNGGGLFLAIYFALLVTFGFALLVTEVAIGRKTKSSPLIAYGKLHEKWKWIGVFAVIVPFLILPYYCAIGGWVLKYCFVFLAGQAAAASESGFFSGFITGTMEPLAFMAIFLFLTFFVVYREIDEGIEKFSKLLMPLLLLIVIGVALFSLTIRYDDGTVARTGLDGLAVYLVPNLDGLTVRDFMSVLLAAMGQLFFSISVAMGIMITYGSYFEDRGNIFKSVWQIGFFDTFVAVLAGLMTVVPIYVLMGHEGMNASGPSLLFVSMPKTFHAMGIAGTIVGAAFFVMTFFAALTSSISIMEAVVSSLMESLSISRRKAAVIESLIAFAIGAVVCFGYNLLYFELPLPNGSVGQVLDVLDYVSNGLLMPVVEIGTCLLVGWALTPDDIINEATKNGEPFRQKGMYKTMIRYVAPILLTILLLQSLGVIG
ncbi:MAG: sodium-dependent transporter [Schwartzia sp.]|nr:sodium-dependent transporter [Schwartzia sp. (in: firmicutes)]MBR1761305.1 sodium-dependent transporter [Schwartzia sp. (in: firmicutes)]